MASDPKRRKVSLTPEGDAMARTVREMAGTSGFDVVVVCTSNVSQEAYWQERLTATRGQAAKAGAVIVAVHEDWQGDGAGNGLGTLYAYTKARAKAKGGEKVKVVKVEMNQKTTTMYTSSGSNK